MTGNYKTPSWTDLQAISFRFLQLWTGSDERLSCMSSDVKAACFIMPKVVWTSWVPLFDKLFKADGSDCLFPTNGKGDKVDFSTIQYGDPVEAAKKLILSRYGHKPKAVSAESTPLLPEKTPSTTEKSQARGEDHPDPHGIVQTFSTTSWKKEQALKWLTSQLSVAVPTKDSLLALQTVSFLAWFSLRVTIYPPDSVIAYARDKLAEVFASTFPDIPLTELPLPHPWYVQNLSHRMPKGSPNAAESFQVMTAYLTDKAETQDPWISRMRAAVMTHAFANGLGLIVLFEKTQKVSGLSAKDLLVYSRSQETSASCDALDEIFRKHMTTPKTSLAVHYSRVINDANFQNLSLEHNLQLALMYIYYLTNGAPKEGEGMMLIRGIANAPETFHSFAKTWAVGLHRYLLTLNRKPKRPNARRQGMIGTGNLPGLKTVSVGTQASVSQAVDIWDHDKVAGWMTYDYKKPSWKDLQTICYRFLQHWTGDERRLEHIASDIKATCFIMPKDVWTGWAPLFDKLFKKGGTNFLPLPLREGEKVDFCSVQYADPKKAVKKLLVSMHTQEVSDASAESIRDRDFADPHGIVKLYSTATWKKEHILKWLKTHLSLGSPTKKSLFAVQTVSFLAWFSLRAVIGPIDAVIAYARDKLAGEFSKAFHDIPLTELPLPHPGYVQNVSSKMPNGSPNAAQSFQVLTAYLIDRANSQDPWTSRMKVAVMTHTLAYGLDLLVLFEKTLQMSGMTVDKLLVSSYFPKTSAGCEALHDIIEKHTSSEEKSLAVRYSRAINDAYFKNLSLENNMQLALMYIYFLSNGEPKEDEWPVLGKELAQAPEKLRTFAKYWTIKIRSTT